MNDGTVLVVGGNFDRLAELYDPESGTWTDAGLTVGLHRGDHTATLLQDGRVLVVGGFDAPDTAEIFDPATRTWTPVGSTLEPRVLHVAALLFDGTVLVAGGGALDCTLDVVPSAETFDPNTGTWTATDSMQFSRTVFGGVALQTDPGQSKVLVGGGITRVFSQEDDCGVEFTRTSEVYEVGGFEEESSSTKRPEGGRRER